MFGNVAKDSRQSADSKSFVTRNRDVMLTSLGGGEA